MRAPRRVLRADRSRRRRLEGRGNGRVQLPRYVCKLLSGKNLRLATSSDVCAAKEESNPICTPKAGNDATESPASTPAERHRACLLHRRGLRDLRVALKGRSSTSRASRASAKWIWRSGRSRSRSTASPGIATCRGASARPGGVALTNGSATGYVARAGNGATPVRSRRHIIDVAAHRRRRALGRRAGRVDAELLLGAPRGDHEARASRSPRVTDLARDAVPSDHSHRRRDQRRRPPLRSRRHAVRTAAALAGGPASTHRPRRPDPNERLRAHAATASTALDRRQPGRHTTRASVADGHDAPASRTGGVLHPHAAAAQPAVRRLLLERGRRVLRRAGGESAARRARSAAGGSRSSGSRSARTGTRRQRRSTTPLCATLPRAQGGGIYPRDASSAAAPPAAAAADTGPTPAPWGRTPAALQPRELWRRVLLRQHLSVDGQQTNMPAAWPASRARTAWHLRPDVRVATARAAEHRALTSHRATRGTT